MNVHVDCTLKRGYSPASVYSKFEKIIKPTGIMKKWKLMQTVSTVTVDFADDTMFTLLFDGQHFDGDCPTVHDSEEPIDKKSADYKKMKLIYALKSICKEYCITDDGTAWFRYLESMRYKAYFRQLTDEELLACGISADLVRFSCGLEDSRDLIEDISQALDACQAGRE